MGRKDTACPTPSLLPFLLGVGGAFLSPASLGGGRAGEGPHNASLTLGGGGASHSCFCFQRRMCRVPLPAGGGAAPCSPKVCLQPPSPLPIWGGGSRGQHQGEPPPSPPRLRFPQTGSSDHTQAWGWDLQEEPGSGAWQAGGGEEG